MKSFFYTLFVGLIFSISSFAQTHVEAKKLLKEASQKMKSYKTLKIEFSYGFENNRVDPPIKQTQNGTIAIKGNNYHLNLGEMEQIRNGNKLYNILNEDEEVQITTYDPEEDEGLTPDKILNLFDKGYSYKLGGTETINGKTIKYVILKPIASEEIDKIMIGIDASTNHIYSMKQWGENGSITILQVTKFSANPTLPVNYFKFIEADYPGYYIAR